MTILTPEEAALKKYNERYDNKVFLYMARSFEVDPGALKANLAIDSAMLACGHPGYSVNKLMNLFALVHHDKLQIIALFEWLNLFIDDGSTPTNEAP